MRAPPGREVLHACAMISGHGLENQYQALNNLGKIVPAGSGVLAHLNARLSYAMFKSKQGTWTCSLLFTLLHISLGVKDDTKCMHNGFLLFI